MGKPTKNGHELWTAAECRCGKLDCNICEHGLAVCMKCNKAEIELDEPCQFSKASLPIKAKTNNPDWPDWIKAATINILNDLCLPDTHFRAIADEIKMAWDAFAASCPLANAPPTIPPNPLEERMLALEIRMDALTNKRESFASVDCSHKTCSFHTHYLRDHDPSKHGERLSHSAFHAAEGCCEAVQKQIMQWINAHPNQTVPEYLQKRADYWEARSAF